MADLAQRRQAIGRTEVRQERIEAESLRRYALAIGTDPAVEEMQPPLPHWACFLPRAEDGQIGADGHPVRGGFLPPIALPRRMFAAADIAFDAPLMIGEMAEQRSTILSVEHKSGRSGDLVFVEVERVLSQRDAVRVRERQTYVYREGAERTPLPQSAASSLSGELWQPDAVQLFRFSAATFNGHRIHYDLDYARVEEGYPALVVHGPFTAAKLAAVAGRRGALSTFAFRAQAPLFLGQPSWLQDDVNEVRAVRCDGAIAMTAKVRYR